MQVIAFPLAAQQKEECRINSKIESVSLINKSAYFDCTVQIDPRNDGFNPTLVGKPRYLNYPISVRAFCGF